MLELTGITKQDIEKQITWWDNPFFHRYLETKSLDFKASWKYATNPCRECFSIKIHGEHIGALTINQPNNNVSIIINPKWWGMGMATKALTLLPERECYTAGIRSHNIGSLIAFLKNRFIISDAFNGIVKLVRKQDDIEVNFGF